LESDIALLFETRGAPDFFEVTPPDHGRIETRRIGCSTALNAYLDFPHVGQVFLIERESIDKKTGVQSGEIALGITSRTPQQASPERVLAVNRGHWSIESVHYIIDWNYDEDRSQIRTGFGPENITRLRRFAVGILKSFQKPAQSIAEMMRKLAFFRLRVGRIRQHSRRARICGADRPERGRKFERLPERQPATEARAVQVVWNPHEATVSIGSTAIQPHSTDPGTWIRVSSKPSKTKGPVRFLRRARFSLTYRRRPLTGSHTGTCSGTGLQITIGAACSTAVDGILYEFPVMKDKPAPS